MAPVYYVSEEAEDDGEHHVHRDNCYRLPVLRKYLGVHPTCDAAVAQARKAFEGAVGCKLCSHECGRA